MSALAELTTLITALGIALETGAFTCKATDEYVVIIPLSDTFEVHADNTPGIEVQEVRLSLFTKGSFTMLKNELAAALLNAEFTITARRYLGYENDTGYHHYSVDVVKAYPIE